MLWQTHATAGANTAWIAYATGASFETVLLIAVLGGFVALIPDIDGDHAKIHNVGLGGVTPLAIFKGGFKHRGFFHSLAAVVLIFIFFILLIPYRTWLLASCLAVAYLSHLILDSITKSGITFWFPKRKKFRLLPKSLTFKTGRSADFLLLILSTCGLIALFFLELPEIQGSISIETLL